MNDEIIEQFIQDISSVSSKIKGMYLFGSRVREDWRPDSDVLIVLERKDREIISKLYDAVIDILISTGKLVSLKIFSEQEYLRLKTLKIPFMSNVLNEGKRIGFNN